MRDDSLQIDLWHLDIPLIPPIHMPKGPVKATYLLLAIMRDKNGLRGIGYSSFRRATDMDAAAVCARNLVTAIGRDWPSLLNVERIEDAIHPASAAGKAAANALSLAAWDLAGKRAGVSCADLWGRPAGRDALDCYASALWLDKSADELVIEAKQHFDNNYRYVKMRVNRSIPENLKRIAAVQTVYNLPQSIALETGFDWTTDIANDFIKQAPPNLLWIEDPAESYDKMHKIEKNPKYPIAAGEKCTSARELLDLYTAGGISNLIIDVQYIGGPVRFLEIARALSAAGATVGGHRFSHYSTHLLATLPRSLPIEMLDWTNPVFAPLPYPNASGQLPVEGPGFRISLNEDLIQRHGIKA